MEWEENDKYSVELNLNWRYQYDLIDFLKCIFHLSSWKGLRRNVPVRMNKTSAQILLSKYYFLLKGVNAP